MINLNFSLQNPFSKRQWESFVERCGRLTKNKAWEVQVCRGSYLFSIDFRLTFRQDHAGLFVGLGICGYELLINVHDIRHWNAEKDCWLEYPPIVQ